MKLTAFLRNVFLPPERFPEEVEVAFLRDYSQRFSQHRRLATFLGLLTWVSYFGWDILHAAKNSEFMQVFWEVFGFRVAGVVTLLIVIWMIRTPSFETDERYATVLLGTGVAAAYALLLAMLRVAPFPYDYLYYFVGLPLVLLFLFGFLRMRAKPVLILSSVLVAVSGLCFRFDEKLSPTGVSLTHLEFAVKQYYWIGALFNLFTFAMIGCAVSSELERTARLNFREERESRWRLRWLEGMARLLRHEIMAPLEKAELSIRELERSLARTVELTKLRDDVEAVRRHVLSAQRRLSGAGQIVQSEEALYHVKMAPLHISTIVERCVDESATLLSAQLEERRARIESDVEKGLRCYGSSDHIEQLLEKLVMNAADFARDGSVVLVKLHQRGNQVILAVENEGRRLPEDKRAIFEPFKSNRETPEKSESNAGIGLWVARRIVEGHGGHIWAEDLDRASGARFVVAFPSPPARGRTHQETITHD